ncbi:MAG: glycoside hydrolase family 32 protein, partial [Bacteroidota bacterium]
MKKYMLLLGILALFWSCQDSTTSSDVTEESKNENMEQHRPIYHFTPPSKWMNDPNGMVYYEGEYHLFYQYYPDGTVWGPMHWGHAVSEDLVNWEHLPIGLYPDSLGYIFSGSAVIDTNNTSGFGKDGQAPMVAIFTLAVEDEKGVPQRQGIAYSNDKGRTWTKYEGNPVIDEGLMAFRDPKVFWHQPTSSWVMSIAATTDNVGIRPDHIRFYSSPDLKNWRLMSDFGYDIGSQGGKWECPDLFKMKVEGTEEYKWVLLVSINPGGPNGGSATQYFIGDFDGERFTLDPEFEKKLVRVSTDKVGGELFENFESTYEGWQVAGTAFGNQPAKGTLAKQNPVSGFNGNALVNSFNEGDATQGKLTSAEFEVKSKYINFLIGGGAHEGKTC